ncbi:MAG: ATP-binding protein [Desulfobacterales bacterium]|nr:ATP-binding protein [Desulfobacterales bacterium]
MKIFGKILFTTLPLVLFSLVLLVGVTFHFSQKALVDLGEIWLDTCLAEAVGVVESQEKMIHQYGLGQIAASLVKAKMDASVEIGSLEVGRHGYIFVVDRDGIMVLHPDKYLVNTDVAREDWFQSLQPDGGRLLVDLGHGEVLARYLYFAPWNWYIFAADPIQEVYGEVRRLKPILLGLSIGASIMISLALMLLTRRLVKPLGALVHGAMKIGGGDLDTRIQVESRDEFGRLALAFNRMGGRLKESLTELKHREVYFRALIENAADMIWILDGQGRYIYVSPSTARILGHNPDTLIGTCVFDYSHPEEQANMRQRFNERVMGVTEIYPVEHRFRHGDGYWCNLESSSSNLLDHPGVRGYVVNSRNITKRKRAERALKRSHQEMEARVEARTRELVLLNEALNSEVEVRRQKEAELETANRAKGEFLANMSHEIRTPLNSVIGFSQLLSTMVKEPDQVSYVGNVLGAGRNLLRLLNEVLDLSKMEAGKLAITQVPTRLADVFDEVGQMFKVQMAEKSLAFISRVEDGVPEDLILDDLRLNQMVTNLVANAVKFTRKGAITVSAEVDDSTPPSDDGRLNIIISIRDTGVGIPEDKRELIFESFQQESAGTSRKYGGTGLGLSICRHLVELMGGYISVESEVNVGSCFRIHLPGVETGRGAHLPQPSLGEGIDLATLAFSGQRVLVADDQESIRLMMREFFEKIGLEVHEAESGRRALEMVKLCGPELIFMDAKMPDLDGISTARMLKEDPETAAIPIVLVTASTHYALPSEGGSKPYVHCMTKPVDLKEMGGILCRYLGTAMPPVESMGQEEYPLAYVSEMRLSPALAQALERRIFPLLPRMEEGMRVSQVRYLSRQVTELGRSHGCDGLIRLGRELHQFVETFDIEKMRLYVRVLRSLVSG